MAAKLDRASFERMRTTLLRDSGTITILGTIEGIYDWVIYLGAGDEILYDWGEGGLGAFSPTNAQRNDPENSRIRELRAQVVKAVDELIDAIGDSRN